MFRNPFVLAGTFCYLVAVALTVWMFFTPPAWVWVPYAVPVTLLGGVCLFTYGQDQHAMAEARRWWVSVDDYDD